MNVAEAERLIALIDALVRSRDEFRALAVCGSWARDNPRPDSDLDALIIAQHADSLRCDQMWIQELKFSDVGFRYVGHKTVKYGVVCSAHIELEPKAELELTVAPDNWASVHSIDPGTRLIVMDAFKVLIDKDGTLERLCSACS
jgi:predicted nucleotidyltransferase